jgi:hypothetical protein
MPEHLEICGAAGEFRQSRGITGGSLWRPSTSTQKTYFHKAWRASGRKPLHQPLCFRLFHLPPWRMGANTNFKMTVSLFDNKMIINNFKCSSLGDLFCKNLFLFL